MKQDEQLEWEARAGRPAAALAFGSAALLVVATILRQGVALSDRPDDDDEFLVAIHDNSDALLASAAVQALCFLALIGALYYFYRVIKARRPELPSFALPLLIGGPILLAVAGILSDVSRLDIADTFLDSGAQTAKRAEDLLDDRDVLSAALGSGGTFALALSLVLLNMNAIRAGVVTRFMGVIGIIIGGLYVLPILSGPLIVQLFWTAALGALFLGYWPGGRGPAWETGKAIPWPSGMARAQEGEDTAAQSIPPEPELESGDAPAQPKRRRSKKRKRR